jgi:hypothetical protein
MACLKHPNTPTYLEKVKTAIIERCKKCGYNKYLQALDFHHLDPKEKEFGLGENRSGRSFKKMIEEASKCALLCCRCHREVHIELEE